MRSHGPVADRDAPDCLSVTWGFESPRDRQTMLSYSGELTASKAGKVGSTPTLFATSFIGRLMAGREVLALAMLVRIQPDDPICVFS